MESSFMKKLLPIWFTLAVILVLGFVYRHKITDRLSRFKMVHAPLGYTGPLQDSIDQHLKEATCWNIHTGSSLPFDKLSHTELGLEYIESTNTYSVGWMQYSVPFLFPEAQEILTEIAQDFQNSISKQSLPKYKLRVTSLIRSKMAQKRLTGNELPTPYWYGYTFSISHHNFIKINIARDDIDGKILKDTFEKVLTQKRAENKILVHSDKESTFLTITLRCPFSKK